MKNYANKAPSVHESLKSSLGAFKLLFYVLLVVVLDTKTSASAPKNSTLTRKETANALNAEFQFVVTGSVADINGEVLPGVNILEKGTTNGTITDLNGKYSISVSSPEAVLSFSYVGYLTEEINVGGQSSINMVLVEDILALDEIVVVGYGTMKKNDLTGSAVAADIEAFRESPNVNIMQSLQGSVPGIQIGQVNQAGEEPDISIRGQTTLSGSKSPLIVVDGIIYRGNIGDLNPSDIESIDILKDASSMAIYGSQAANGVILITSKGGSASKKPTISYSASFATQTPTIDAKLLGRKEILQKVKDIMYENAYLAPDYTQPDPDWDYSQSELLPALLDGIENGTNYDWWGQATSPGHIMDHLLSISGGTESTTYYVSGGFTDQKGYIINDKYNRATVRINLQTKITDWLTLGTNTFGAFTNFSGEHPDMETLARTSPLAPSKNENGEYIVNHLGDYLVNPFLNSSSDDLDKNNNISGNFYALVSIPSIKGLSYRLNYSNNYRWFMHANSNKYSAGLTGAAYKENTSNYDMMLDNILTYDKQFNNHGIKLTLVSGYNKVEYEKSEARGENFANLSLSYNSIEQAIIQTISSDAWSEASIYQMGRLNYNFKNKYLLTTTLRRDGFSGFAKNNKTVLFPSIGLGWVLTEEQFFNIESIDYLKIRASYGKNGNLTPRYSSLARVSAGEESKYVFGDGGTTAPGQSVETLANSNLSWESTTGLNIGIDFGVLNNRVRGNIDYYNTTTTDLLWEQVLPEITGFSEIRTNLGEIANSGLEISLFTIPVKSNDFSWNFDVSFSTNKNEIVELLGIDGDGDGEEDDLIASELFIGKSIGAIYDYEVDGVWQIGDDIQDGFFAGTYRIVDQNDDGEITAEEDRVFLGRSEPAYRFSIYNTFTYKNFTLRVFINSIQGGKDGYLKSNHPNVSGTTGTAQNSNWFNFYDYWSPSNPGAKYPQRWLNAQINPVQYFSRNFVRLQDVSLSYKFSNTLTEKLNIGDAKIFVNGKNLLTFTDWDGWDPETGQGIQIDDAFPLMKAYTIGLNISF